MLAVSLAIHSPWAPPEKASTPSAAAGVDPSILSPHSSPVLTNRRAPLGNLSASSTQRKLIASGAGSPLGFSPAEEDVPSGPRKRRAVPRWLSRRSTSSVSADVKLRFSLGTSSASSSPSSAKPPREGSSGNLSGGGSPSKGFALARRRCGREASASSERDALSETSCSSTTSSGPSLSPPWIARRNSLAETKIVFMRSDMRSASFSSSADEDHAFTFDAHFDWNGKLGSGSFADVYAVRHKTRPDETYAVKVLKKEMGSRQDRAAYLREVELANTLPPHPHIVSYLRAWQDECILYVQMELCVGGTLREQMAARPLHTRACDGVVWRLVRQVASALAHIHSAYLIHCDVKPDNVLLDKRGNYKVGDLGQATALSSWDEQEGDARYIAADLLHGNPSAAADIFSFGIMLLEIKSNRPLPGHGDEWKALRATDAAPLLRARMHQQAPQQAAGVEEGGEGAPHTAAVDARLERLVISMMSTAPAERPDAKAVGDACPWPVEPQTRSIGMRLLRAAFRGVNAFSSTRRATKGGMI